MSSVSLIASPLANLANIERALRVAGGDVTLARDPSALAGASRVVLPGVGNFGASMRWLLSSGFALALREAVERGAALLGVCVGHQLLFDRSDEDPSIAGLALVRGFVRRLDAGLPVPQVAWNSVAQKGRSPLFDGIEDGAPFYFVNSYAATDVDCAVATSDYGGRFAAAIRCDRIHGVQFHPEKSSTAGLRLLRNFLEMS
jgi:glutamine amidotransferase